MARIAVMTDSNSGITQKRAADLGIKVIPMPFTIDGRTYYEDINLTRDDFFRMQAEGKDIKTSQPLPEELFEVWDGLLKEYDEVVHIPMSSGLSGSCQSAKLIAQEYEGRVHVADNQRISVTQLSAVLDAMKLAECGLTGAEIVSVLEDTRFDSSIYIMLDTLVYLKKGGRITPAAAAVGTLVRITPVLMIKGEKLDAYSKARTAAQGRMTMINAMKNDIEKLYGGTDHETVQLYTVDGQCPDELREFHEEVQDALPGFHVLNDSLSLSVCCHIGPGALAVACSKKMDHEAVAESIIRKRSE